MKTILLFLFLSLSAQAQTRFTGIVSNSLGGAGRAAVVPEEVALLNPATLVHQKGYQFSTAYRDFNVRDEGSIYDFLAQISENQIDTMFPLSITYHKTRNFFGSENNRTEDFHFSVANMLFQNFSLGLDFRRHKLEENNQKETEWDGSVGLLWLPTANLGLGLVHRNLMNSDSVYLNKTWEFGVNYLFGEFFRVLGDVVYPAEQNPGHRAIYMLGAEHKVQGHFPLRIGAKWDQVVNQNYWTAGFGWNGPKIGLDVVYEKNFSENQEYSTGVDLKIYF